MEEILIVDGYNVIGDWKRLKEKKHISLEEARDDLLGFLAEYQGYTGIRVIVVFDAHNVKGQGKKMKEYRLDIRYTKEKETADECIERLVFELFHRHRQIYVATSDYTEQRVTFGYGALRKSARELWIDMKQVHQDIGEKVKETKQQPKGRGLELSDEIKKKFENWRRGNT
ncbi:NYN domain-containing protein [Aneurinibacillus tyrosinisolvens]|uniref:NYN domain-containing protein n=1 Tax=Aneurinibacillus tyrosinisolvens TaxID=1443435 RepID=UPI00063F913A|nr:NYN domain-containing protein [Aneurinibacillus tyrosinisolvens]